MLWEQAIVNRNFQNLAQNTCLLRRVGLASAQDREQKLLIFLRVHILPCNKDAGDFDKIVSLFSVCHTDGLLDGHVAHVERPLRDDGLDDILLQKLNLPLRIVAADNIDLPTQSEIDQRVCCADVADFICADKAPDLRVCGEKFRCDCLRLLGRVVAAEAAENPASPSASRTPRVRSIPVVVVSMC